MASATIMTPLDMDTLSLNHRNPSTTSKGESTNTSIDYWTKLIRKSLAIAQSQTTVDSDTEDANPSNIDEEILHAPRRKSTRDALAKAIAAELYPAPPDSLAPIIKYEKDIVMLRSMVLDQRRTAIARATARNERHNWIKRILSQGPWDEAKDPLSLVGAPSLPMPVEQSDKDSLAPFFAHLSSNGTHQPSQANTNGIVGIEPYYSTELIGFEKGVLYADGRVDLCKMVTGPRNIGDLMESLKTNTFSRHFLLGNNIIGPTGARAIADFIEEFPERMETWYLAGNCIDGTSFKVLVDAMVKSQAVTNVWLKRNPLGPGAAKDVFRLVTETVNLRTLDLDQTELGDAGIAALFDRLAGHVPEKPLGLRHIYLNACGVGETASKAIAAYLQSGHCTIESLYLSNNPIGDAVTHLAVGLESNTSLKRLVLQSCGLKDEGVIALAEALKGNQNLIALDIGQNYATEDLSMRFNWITEVSAPALAELIKTTNLQYFSISYTPMSQFALKSLLTAITTSSTLFWFFVKPLEKGGKDAASVKAGQEHARLYKLARERLHANVKEKYGIDYLHFENEHKRFLISPKDVRLIDSVYRNRDAAAARRGLKRLEKWWEDGDETLLKVQDGTLE